MTKIKMLKIKKWMAFIIGLLGILAILIAAVKFYMKHSPLKKGIVFHWFYGFLFHNTFITVTS